MPYNLLQRLAAATLPCRLTDPLDLQHLEDLRDAGYVKMVWVAQSGGPRVADVTHINPIGLIVLKTFGPF
jgi:hypothetical protein